MFFSLRFLLLRFFFSTRASISANPCSIYFGIPFCFRFTGNEAVCLLSGNFSVHKTLVSFSVPFLAGFCLSHTAKRYTKVSYHRILWDTSFLFTSKNLPFFISAEPAELKKAQLPFKAVTGLCMEAFLLERKRRPAERTVC